ncbi:MAG: lytic transglycosylase domain-containing protein [Candidatus Riflebacteria bacterium]|nr:lytic transglycosylase domain-containing protein [Candidatus Riflebacteria bacterium]
MKKTAIILVALLYLGMNASYAQSPFEVNNTGAQGQKNIVAADSGSEQTTSGSKKELSGFFKILKGVLDALKAVVDGIIPGANAAEIDEMSYNNIAGQAIGKQPATTVKTTKTAEGSHGTGSVDKAASNNASTANSTGVVESKSAVVAPAAVKPETPAGKAVSIGSAQFKTWFKAATDAYCGDWEFPDVTNKYGEKISREDYMRAIIWIESRGIHKNARGTLTKSWAGAMGFMQLMPNTARGLKIDAKDPAQNLKGGAKYLAEIFNSGAVSKKTGAEKLIMGACAYNLGPFSRSMKLSWNELKASKKIPVETRGYGLKLKMCLGLELTEGERMLVKEWLVGPGQTVDSLIEENYTNTKGIAR